jgi:general stress protein 26
MGIELTANERWELLEQNMVMRLATVDPSGRPHIVPIWYLSHHESGNIYFSTPEDTRKARDIAETPKVSLTVDEGVYYFELQAVVVEGEAFIVNDDKERAMVEEGWCQKYFEQPDRPDFLDDLYRGRRWEWYRIEPVRWLSWDNSKIDLDQLRDERE